MDKLEKKLIKSDDVKWLSEVKLDTLHRFKLYLDDKYYNTGDSIVPDWKYDILKDFLISKDGSYIPPIGAKLRESDIKVKAPYWLSGADKITPEEQKELDRWLKNNKASAYICSDKLDGVSCLLVHKNGKTKLYKRGGSSDGLSADVTYLLPYLKSIPKNLPDIAVRGELIMKRSVFKKKHSSTYRNPRNMVSGLTGAKTARDGLKDIDFVVYELVDHGTVPKPSKNLKELEKLGFLVVHYEVTNVIDIDVLSEMYLRFKKESLYDLDGVIVQPDIPYERNTSGQPDYMFAFKMRVDGDIHTTKVKSVEWTESKWGRFKPVVIVEPVDVGDVTISRASGYNAKYIEEEQIGPGTVLRITRSKDVIPKIIEIIKPTKAQFPDRPYKWDKNHVDIISTHKGVSSTACVKLLAGFFSKLGIKHVSEATVKKMYDDGLNNLFKILSANKARLAKIPTFGERLAERTYDNIHNRLQNVKLATVLGSSGVFGASIGRRKIEQLLRYYPDILDDYKRISEKELERKILKVEGYSDITAKQIIKNVRYADRFKEKIKPFVSFSEEKRVGDSLLGKKFVFSGFRSAELEDEISQRGGQTTSSVSKNTTAVIAETKTATGKVKKAIDLGIGIYTREEFKDKYLK